LTTTQLDWRIWVTAGAAAAVAAAAVASRWMRRPEDPDETERRRRSYVSQVGRIVEGHIIELVETAAPAAEAGSRSGAGSPLKTGTIAANGRRRLVCYSYSISGVSYETAQDVTGLEARVSFDRLVAGQPASVKYDPSNPTNSILLADDWSGLH
jgi:hypothetical protein